MTNVDKTELHGVEEKKLALMLTNQIQIEVDGDDFKRNGIIVNQDPDEPAKAALERAQEQMRKEYRKLLSKPFENIMFLSGAGTSKSSNGKTMVELWDDIFPTGHTHQEFFTLIKVTEPTNNQGKDLEHLLSHATKAADVSSPADSTKIKAVISIIESRIKVLCNLTLDTKKSPHLTFLNKVTSRKIKHPRVKIFTLNYDTLFEQAGSEGNFVVINGFSFTQPSYFDGSFYDYDIVKRGGGRVSDGDSFIPKVFQLFKPHGSLHWSKNEKGDVIAGDIFEAAEKPLIVFPNSDKYESSYDQPFFEMMSRFQQSIRTPNTLLICSGFSFGDKHFKNVILEAVKSNPGLNLLIAMSNFETNDNAKEFVSLIPNQNNITFISEHFEEFANYYPFAEDYEHETIQ